MQALFLIPVVAFVLISGWFNYLFSSTLGSGTTWYAWVILGGFVAVYAALGLDLMRQAWKRGSPAKALAAFVLWVPCVGYDGVAAYGFATHEQSAAVLRLEEASKPLAKARADVARAREALKPYEHALDETAAAEAVGALEKQTTDTRCRLPKLHESERDACTSLTKARLVLSQAAAKARLMAALIAAEQDLANAPVPPPADKRADILGHEIVAWLPVVLLQLGTILGVFAATIPSKPKPTNERPKMPKSIPPSLQGVSAAVSAKREQTVVELIASLSQRPDDMPTGLRVDDDGWIRGGQRRFAAAASIPLTRFNRDAKTAWRKGLIEMKTDGNETAVRLGSAGSA